MQRADSLEKILVLGKTESERRSREQRMRQFDSITDSMVMNLIKLWETVEDRGAWYATVHVVRKSRTWLSNWTAMAVDYSHHAAHCNPRTCLSYNCKFIYLAHLHSFCTPPFQGLCLWQPLTCFLYLSLFKIPHVRSYSMCLAMSDTFHYASFLKQVLLKLFLFGGSTNEHIISLISNCSKVSKCSRRKSSGWIAN